MRHAKESFAGGGDKIAKIFRGGGGPKYLREMASEVPFFYRGSIFAIGASAPVLYIS